MKAIFHPVVSNEGVAFIERATLRKESAPGGAIRIGIDRKSGPARPSPCPVVIQATECREGAC